jgi:hypothetical protein
MRFQADQTSCPGVRGRQVSTHIGRNLRGPAIQYLGVLLS